MTDYFFFAGAFAFGAAFTGLAVRSFSALPGVNLPFVLAAILIALPVCGFLPVRAARVTALNVPKPTRVTLSPALIAAVVAVMKPLRAFSDCAFVNPASSAIFATSSTLVINPPRIEIHLYIAQFSHCLQQSNGFSALTCIFFHFCHNRGFHTAF